MRRFWIFKAVLFFIAAFFVFGFAAMYLWNWLVPDLFHGPVITFGQAIGIVVLSKLLFGFGMRGSHGGWRHREWRNHWRHNWKEKWDKMTPEQRDALRKRWEGRCGSGWNFPAEEKATTPTA